LKPPTTELTLWGWLAECEETNFRPEPKEVAEILWLTDDQAIAHDDAMPTNRDFVASLQNDSISIIS